MLSIEEGDERFSLRRSLAHFALVGILAVVYMSVSTGLISFNNYLMQKDRFPFAICLALVHMTCSSLFNSILLLFRPSFFPSLSDPMEQTLINVGLVAKILLPIACCFAAQLVLSNLAFMHSSVAFLQMMKESNVVLVYVFSIALNLDQFCWRRGCVLLFIISATAMTVHGEIHLSYTGFLMQGTSIICESVKLTLQSYALSVNGKRLDAFTYVALLAPLVIVVLGVTLIVLSCLCNGGPRALQLPSLDELLAYRWLLVASGTVAFGMNLSHAAFVKQSSAITFILVGVLLKDVLIVAAGAALMGNPLSATQAVGFSMQLLGICVWSWMKLDLINDNWSVISKYLPELLGRGMSSAGGSPLNSAINGDLIFDQAHKNWHLPRAASEASTREPSTEVTDELEQLMREMTEESKCLGDSARELVVQDV